MKQFLPRAVQNLSQALAGLPGIGPKTAHRLTFYLLKRPDDELERLGQAVRELKKDVTRCHVCLTVAERDPCPICADPARDHRRILVVEEPLDMLAMEKTGFDGVYHVLGGVISPINGVGPNDLTISQLVDRVGGDMEEVVLATDPSLEGEATASFIAEKMRQIAGKKMLISRIARGLPVGGDLEYADEMTLRRALEGRAAYGQKEK